MFKILLIIIYFSCSSAQNHLLLTDERKIISIPTFHPQTLPLSLTRLFSFQIAQTPSQQFFAYSPQTVPYINFSPTSLQLQQRYRIKVPSAAATTFQDLRSPYQFQYKSIVVLDDCIVLMKEPNKIIIVQKQQSAIPITQYFLNSKFITYTLKQITLAEYNPQLHHLGSKYALGLYFSTGKVFLVNKNGLYASNTTITGLVWLQSLNERQFITAEGENGLAHYFIEDAVIRLNARYTTDLSTQGVILHVTDFSIASAVNNIINVFILCEMLGVVEVNIDLTNKVVKNKRTTMTVKQCNAIDVYEGNRYASVQKVNNNVHLVISCRNDQQTYILYQMTLVPHKQSLHKIIYTSLPYHHKGMIRDVSLSAEYFLTDEEDTINVFWGYSYGEKKGYSVQPITLTRLQCFKKHNDTLFVVRKQQLILYHITVAPYNLRGNSTVPTQKTFTLRAQIQCSDYNGTQNANQELCLYEKDFNVSFHNGDDRRINICLSLFMIGIGIILLCLCLNKYLKLEKTARETLQNILQREKKQKMYQFKL